MSLGNNYAKISEGQKFDLYILCWAWNIFMSIVSVYDIIFPTNLTLYSLPKQFTFRLLETPHHFSYFFNKPKFERFGHPCFYTILILGTSLCGRFSNLRNKLELRYGIFRPMSVVRGRSCEPMMGDVPKISILKGL